MSKRLRISHIIVQPVLVWDDGEELLPGPRVQPIQVPLSNLVGLVDSLPAEVKQAEERLTSDET